MRWLTRNPWFYRDLPDGERQVLEELRDDLFCLPDLHIDEVVGLLEQAALADTWLGSSGLVAVGD